MESYEYGLMWRLKDSNDEWKPVPEDKYGRMRSRPRVYPLLKTAQGYLTMLRNGGNGYWRKRVDDKEYKLVKRKISDWEDL